MNAPLGVEMAYVHNPRVDPGIDLVATIRLWLQAYCTDEQLSLYDTHRLIRQAANGTDPQQQMFLNEWFALQLMGVPEDTRFVRIYLDNTTSCEKWLEETRKYVLPWLARFSLPR